MKRKPPTLQHWNSEHFENLTNYSIYSATNDGKIRVILLNHKNMGTSYQLQRVLSCEGNLIFFFLKEKKYE